VENQYFVLLIGKVAVLCAPWEACSIQITEMVIHTSWNHCICQLCKHLFSASLSVHSSLSHAVTLCLGVIVHSTFSPW